jgi:superfamily II DNA or RNA helicase
MAPLRQEQRGKAFELLTELYLQIDPIYRSKLPHVWHETNLPASVRNKLNLPSPDIGVDLVAKDRSGKYWAIQCKYHHDPSKNVTKNELNSFLDVTTRVCRGKFDTLLAVSSAHGYSAHLEKHAPEVQYCLSDTFQGLDGEFFRQARTLLRKQTPRLKKRSPRPHQRKAIENAIKHFVENGETRGKLIHPCGTGKSLIGYWIAHALEAKTAIVALPSLYLARQTLADWTKESLALKKNIDWMVVCSEDTIGDSGDPAMRFQEIGVDVTTDVSEIAAFLRKRTTGKKVIFTTYQSGKVTAEAAKRANRIFDVGIFDEAHRTVGQKDALFSHLIDEQNIRIRKRVFMTATERRYRGSSDTILSMDDADAYGDTFDKVTFREALEAPKPILSDYKLVTMVVGRSEIQDLIDQNFLVKPDKGKWDDDTEARSLAALIALRKAMKRYRASHALTFHNSIAKAEAFKESQERFSEAVKGYGRPDCYHVSSKVSTGERKQEIERFRHSKKAIITNAKCLTEGVDVPAIDAVLFADTKRSTVDIVQAAGRALRPAEGKQQGYIIVPVLVEEDDPGAADKAFQDILMTLRAMASNDDRIIDYFRSISQGMPPSKSGSVIDFVVPDPVKVKLTDFIDSIETQSWHRLSKLSWRPFDDARKFVQSLGLRSTTDWWRYVRQEMPTLPKKPHDIPSDPSGTYADKGWENWGDWLGTGYIAPRNRTYRPFEQARKFVRSLNLKSRADWEAYCRKGLPNKTQKPTDIPTNASAIYSSKEWLSWGDWLGTERTANQQRKYRSFNSARKFARSLGIKSRAQWLAFCRGELQQCPPKPEDVPAGPARTYAGKGWAGWGDWLGSGNISVTRRRFRPFKDARAFAHALNLQTWKDWQEYCKGELQHLSARPEDIPSDPPRVYRNKGWLNWGDWLGSGRVAPQNQTYRPFREARDFVHSLNLKNTSDWRAYCRGELPDLPPKPDDIPSGPARIYADEGWSGLGDWLGTGRIAKQNREYRSFDEARAYVHSLNLKSMADWQAYCRGELQDRPLKPDDIPKTPSYVYADKGWISWPDWLGTDR